MSGGNYEWRSKILKHEMRSKNCEVLCLILLPICNKKVHFHPSMHPLREMSRHVQDHVCERSLCFTCCSLTSTDWASEAQFPLRRLQSSQSFTKRLDEFILIDFTFTQLSCRALWRWATCRVRWTIEISSLNTWQFSFIFSRRRTSSCLHGEENMSGNDAWCTDLDMRWYLTQVLKESERAADSQRESYFFLWAAELFMLSLSSCRLCFLSISRFLTSSSLCFSSAEPSLSMFPSPSMLFNSEQNATRPWWSSWTWGDRIRLNKDLFSYGCEEETLTCRMTFCSESTCWFSSLILSSFAGWFTWTFLFTLPFMFALTSWLSDFPFKAKH